MAIYTVLAPPARDGDAADPTRTVFVKDGFAWPALFFALIWLIYRRMWLVLILYVAIAAAAGFVLQRAGGDSAGLVVILLHFLFVLEANNLRRWTLERRGFRFAGIAEGRNLEEAEIRYFSGMESGDSAAIATAPTAPATPPPPSPPSTAVAIPPAAAMPGVLYREDAVRRSAEAGDVVGLFPAPATTPGNRSS